MLYVAHKRRATRARCYNLCFGNLSTHEWCAQEIKAKEMEELAKTLAELGIAAPAAGEEEGAEAAEEKRKKKKKDKKGKAAEGNGEVPPPETNGTAKENEPMEEPVEEDSSESLDPAEVRGSSSPGVAASPVAVSMLPAEQAVLQRHICRHPH